MPGISVQYDGGAGSIGGRLAAARHDARYESRVVVEWERGALGYTGYPGYPIETRRIGEFTLVFEGYVYGWNGDDVTENLRRLVADRFDGFADRAAIERWVRTTDGEFVLAAVHEESGEVTIVGDCLGRLPLYYATNENGMVISRERRVVADWLAAEGSEGNDLADDVAKSEDRERGSTEREDTGEHVREGIFGYERETDGGVALGSSGRETVGSEALKVHESDLPVSVDRLGLAQYLLFGHTLGARTFVEGVKRLPSAPFVRVTEAEVTVERLCAFDFGARAHDERSREENGARLARLFERACRRRAAPGGTDGASAPEEAAAESTVTEGATTESAVAENARSTTGAAAGEEMVPDTRGGTGSGADESESSNLIALGSGDGSRAVLAAFAEGDLPCIAGTVDHSGTNGADVASARALAAHYGVPWRRYGIETPDARPSTSHAALADARDPFASRLRSVFEEVCDEHGSLTVVSGAGGDETLFGLVPPSGFADREDLLASLVDRDGQYGIGDAAALAGVNVERLAGSVRERLESYPERDLEGKYVRFQIEERARNGVFEDEDAGRRFFWCTSPFYSLPFFRYAMNCPDGQKRWRRLYRSFLATLSGGALEPATRKTRVAAGSVLYAATARAFETLGRHPEVFDALEPLAKRVPGIDSEGARRDGASLLEASTPLDHLSLRGGVPERHPDATVE